MKLNLTNVKDWTESFTDDALKDLEKKIPLTNLVKKSNEKTYWNQVRSEVYREISERLKAKVKNDADDAIEELGKLTFDDGDKFDEDVVKKVDRWIEIDFDKFIKKMKEKAEEEEREANVRVTVEKGPKAFNFEDPSTWDIKDVKIHDDVEGIVENATDWRVIKDKLKDAALKPEHGSIQINARFHAHLNGGGGGISFIYLRKSDTSDDVVPYVYDATTKRDGNDYTWERGGKKGGPSGASLK